MTENKITPSSNRLKFRHILKNYVFLSDLSYTLVNFPSRTNEEIKLKREIYWRTRSYMSKGAFFVGISTLVGFTRFCLKSKRNVLKVATGVLYYMWYYHLLILGNHLGIMFSLTNSINSMLTLPENSADRKVVENFASRILKNEKDLAINDVYKELYGVSALKENDAYLENDFFIKNRDKFFKNEANSDKLLSNELDKQDGIILDNFFVRYIITHMRRFWRKNIA